MKKHVDNHVGDCWGKFQGLKNSTNLGNGKCFSFLSIVNYLTDKSNKADPWRLIAIYMSLSFLQGGGIGMFLFFNFLDLLYYICCKTKDKIFLF